MKILALDLGQSSIGWIIRNTDNEGENQFEKFGVITFDKGVGEEKNIEYSLAAERTKYRSARRLYQSRKYKLWETLKKLKAQDFCPIDEQALIEWSTYDKEKGLKRKYPTWDINFENWIKLDFNGDNVPDFDSPYQLRKVLAENQLDFNIAENRYKLGRALYHIAQHRAFKSSKKVKLEEDEKDTTDVGAEHKKKENLKKEFEKIGILFDENKTIGQLLAEAEMFFKKRGYGRIRNELHPYVTRKMLQQEVEQIFKFQFGDKWVEKFKDIFGVEKVSKCSIFWQRPLRSQKSAVGKCTLEKSKYRCPVSHPQFEIFRAWSFINNIRYKLPGKDEWKELTIEQKQKLYQDEFIKASDFTVLNIRKWLSKELLQKEIILNYTDKTNVSGSPSIYYLSKILGNDWQTHQIQHEPIKRIKKSNHSVTYCSKKDYYNYEDIWHVAFQLDDEEEIENIARNKFKFNDAQIELYLRWFKNMAVDYARLSLKAIKNINYFLQKGLIYTDAVLLAKIPEILDKSYNSETEKLLIDSLQKIIQQNRAKKQVVNITNNLISEYKINHFHERDFDYQIQADDINRITQKCEEFFGKSKWEQLKPEEQTNIIENVKREFQSFFQDTKREYKKLPKLMDDLKQFLKDNFEFLDDKKLNKLYHPSAIDIYPKLTERDKAPDGKLYLQSPKTGSWKNPMAMRVLEELRKLINYLIQTDQIDQETKIVVEIPRELNDTNKRKAYEIWQKRKEEENKEFAMAIAELIKQNPNIKANENNDSDIDKFRIWYEQCFDETSKEFTEKGPNELKIEKKKNKKGEETNEDIGIWSENRFSNINTSLWFKIQNAKNDILEKYNLWNEQKAMCIYTGKIISLSDLFNEDTIDIEHTLPYSRSFDNSLANKTVCFKEYNRKTKKNLIPAECPNHDEILSRIKPWEEKIENIKKHLEFWKNESKKAKTPERKNQCIVEKHLWTWELEYWQNKVERFKMKEITTGFVNAQLVETQLISKYAFHYLKTLFEKVQVQKGSITADFAKILGLRDKYKSKIRDKHTHHTIDAFVLSLIPDSARLKSILEKNAEIEELKKINEYANSQEKNIINERINSLQEEINQLIIESRIPINTLHRIANKIENNTIAITPTREKIFATAKKKIRKGKLKGKFATGDVVRGQLHLDTFYGKIKVVKRDKDGKPQRDKQGNLEFIEENDGYKFVKRIELNKILAGKKNKKASLKKFLESIVDPSIKNIFITKIKNEKEQNNLDSELKAFEKILNDGNGGLLYTHPKTGKIIRIRHVRCFQKPTELLVIKPQSHTSKHEYKNWYYADNAENVYYALYEDEKGNRTFEMLNLFDAIKIKQSNPVNKPEFFESYKEIISGKNKTQVPLKAILYPKQKIILYQENKEELKELKPNILTQRIYKIKRFEKDGRIILINHLEARNTEEIKNEVSSQIILENLSTLLRISKSNFNFAIEGKDFEINPDGEINWKF